MGMPDFKKGQAEKYGQNWKKLSFFQGNQGQLFQFCPGGTEIPLLHILDLNYLSFYLKCPRKYQNPKILIFFQHFPKFAPFALPNFGEKLNFNHTSLCVYY